MKHKSAIIIVDDSKIIVDRIIALLNDLPNMGTILTAYNYEEAIKLIENNKADILLLDINLPGKSGIDLLKFISDKALYFKLIIAMTEDTSERKKEICMKLGAHYFLNKFNDFEMIPDIIRSVAI